MRKLIVIPASCHSLGGAAVSLSMMLKGFEKCDACDQLRVLVQSGSLIEQYLNSAGQSACLQPIQAHNRTHFAKYALQWVGKQPKNWPLLLENWVFRDLLVTIIQESPKLRLSGRPVYHVFRDLTASYNPLNRITKQFAFRCLSPHAICNSQFTAESIKNLLPNIKAILYPSVDLERFNNSSSISSPPENLQPILNSGARIMLTPSRITEPEKYNDKNLLTLVSVLAELKETGHYYHGVIIGEDYSQGKAHTRVLLERAEQMGVADRFTILPPAFSIEDYYKYADVVVTLAPREPFGRTVIEAIACNIPVVGSRTGGIGESLGKFAPEWTVEPFASKEVAQTIIRIADDPNTPYILTQGRRWIEEHCDPVKYAKKILKITGLTSVKQPETKQNSPQLTKV